MTAAEILAEIEPLGAEGYRRILRNHGIPDPMYGVKIEYLKVIEKRVKKDYQLAKDLYDTGIYDAQYLAGLIADDAKMTKEDLNHWVSKANNSGLNSSTVPWVASQGRYGHELALEWIESKDENVAVAGWSTLSCLVALKDDSQLDIDELKGLLHRVGTTILEQPNAVRRIMNGFIISVGSYVKDLTELALQTAAQVGTVYVDVGNTACKVPAAAEYIEKVRKRGTIGKKRKTVKC
jgi:hypothetical protein